MLLFAQVQNLTTCPSSTWCLRNPRIIRDIVIVEHDKGNGVVILE